MADPNGLPPLPPGFTLDTPTAPTVAPAPAPGGGPYTVGTPHPKEPPQHTLPAAPQAALTPDEKVKFHLPPDAPYFWSQDGIPTLPQGYKDANDSGMSRQSAMNATRSLIQSIEKARGYVTDANTPIGNTATGLGYNLLKHSPVPTDATALESTIKGEVQGNIFQQWMNSMKAASAQEGGSAFGGRILASEVPFIVNALGTLEPGKLKPDQLLGNMDQIEERVIRSAALLNNENPDDPKVYQKYHTMFLPPKPAKKDDSNAGATITPVAPTTPGGGGESGTPTPPTNGGGTDPDQLQILNDTMRLMFHRGAPTSDIVAYGKAHGVDPNPAEIDHARANGMDVRFVQPTPPQPPTAGHEFAVGAGGVAQGVGDVLGIVSNPFIKAYNYITGSNITPDMGANVRDALGLPAPKTDTEKLAATINDYGTQALTMANAARLAAAKVPGVIGSALETFGNRPLTDAASGATGGAASEGTRQAGGGPVLQTAATLAAGVPTAALGTRLAQTSERALPAVVNAGNAEGVTVNRAMANPALEPKVIAAGKTMVGAKNMRAGMADVGSQIQGRTQALGQGGEALDNLNLGEKAQGIGQRYISQSGAQFGRQYDRLKTASQGVPIQAKQSLDYIDGLLQRLNKTPDTNAKEIAYLTGVRNDLSRGLDVESSRDIGSRLSRDIRKGDVTFGPMERDVLGLRNAVSQDISNGLAAAGKGNVAAQFKQVDGAYQQRMNFIRNTIQKLTGPRDRPLAPEQAAARIKAWAGAKGDSASLQKIMGQATPEERNDIAATFADSLGKGQNGEFSTTALAKNAGLMPRGVRSIIFGEDGARSLDNLRVLASEHARVTRALGGSPTALAGDARSWVMHMLFGGGLGGLEGGGVGATLGAIAGPAAMQAAKIGKDAFTSKSLMSPKITGWLRMAPKTDDPQKVAQWMDRLKVIAVREPALSPEINRIQSAFLNAANENVTPRAAASGANQDNGNE